MIGARAPGLKSRLRNGFITWHRTCSPGGMKVHDLVSAARWAAIEPLLPPQRPHPKGGRPWLPDRPALCGILSVLTTGLQWRMLPQELGCGSGVTCWRRLRDWQAAGVWQALHRVLLDRLGAAGRLDWSRASLDRASVRAKGGARRPAPTRLIARNPAPSTTSWWIGGASRSPAASAGRTAPTTGSSRR